MGSESLQANAEEHFHNPATHGEWAISVASLPEASAEEVVAAAHQILHRKFRVADADALADAGFVPVQDNPPHALLLLPSPPDEDMWVQLRTLFNDVRTNPYYQERRDHAGG